MVRRDNYRIRADQAKACFLTYDQDMLIGKFGLGFHQNLLETVNPFAERIDKDPEGFCRTCEALGGEKLSHCDLGYSLKLFEELPVAIRFWHSDDEFPPSLCWLWDANALQYIKYETVYFAIALIEKRITEGMAACG